MLAERAGRTLKRTVLELGGFNPMIILDDVDMEYAVRTATFGSFFHQGQICLNTRRIIVQRKISEEFLAKFATRTNADVTAPPDGLSLRSHVHDLAVGRGLGLLAGAGATGHVVGYKSGDTSSVEIMLLAGDDDLLQLQRYFLTKGGSDLQVRGHPGWVSTSQQPRNGVSIVWQEAPGVIGVAGATGLDQARPA